MPTACIIACAMTAALKLGTVDALVGDDLDRLALVAGFLRAASCALAGSYVIALLLRVVRNRPRSTAIGELFGLPMPFETAATSCGMSMRGSDRLAQLDVLQQRIARLEQEGMLCRPRSATAPTSSRICLQLGHVGSPGSAAMSIGAGHAAPALTVAASGTTRNFTSLTSGALGADIAVAACRPAARLIVVEAGQRDVLAALPLAELERAGADRLVPAAVGLDRILVQDRRHAAIGARQLNRGRARSA